MKKRENKIEFSTVAELQIQGVEKSYGMISVIRLFYYILTIAVIAGGITHILDLPLDKMNMVMIVLPGVICFWVIFQIKKTAKAGFWIFIFGYVLVLYWNDRLREQAKAGMVWIANIIINLINEYYNMEIPFFQTWLVENGAIECFFNFFIIFITAIVGFTLIYCRKIKLSVFLLLVVIWGGLFLGKVLPIFYVFLLIGTIFGLFSMTEAKKSRGLCSLKDNPVAKRVQGKNAFVTMIVIVFVFGIAFTMKDGKMSRTILGYHENAVRWQKIFAAQLQSYAYSMQNNLSVFWRGNKQENGILHNNPIMYEKKEVLRVTSDIEIIEPIYLKGFVGDDYDGNRWKEVDATSFYKEAWQWTNSEIVGRKIQGFPYHSINGFYRNPFISFIPMQGNMKISYTDVSTSYLYNPYYSFTEERLIEHADAYMFRLNQKEVNYKVYSDYVPLWNGVHEMTEEYKALEQNYAGYVRRQYLSVPEKGLGRLKELCAGRKGDSIAECIQYLADVFAERTKYSIDVEPLPENADFVENFLFEQGKGRCTHYASATVLMLRMMGIPARYATGYVVSPDSFQMDASGCYTASVLDEQSHAWAEVYLEGFGWVPLDMTPSYENWDYEEVALQSFAGQIEREEVERRRQDALKNIPQKQETEKRESVRQNPIQTQKKWSVVWVALSMFTILVILLMLTIMGLVIRRDILLKKKQKQIHSKERNTAIVQMTIYLYQMFEFCHLQLAEESEIMGELIQVAEKARFGNESVSEEEWKQFWRHYRKTATALYRQQKGIRKILWEYWYVYNV